MDFDISGAWRALDSDAGLVIVMMLGALLLSVWHYQTFDKRSDSSPLPPEDRDAAGSGDTVGHSLDVRWTGRENDPNRRR